MTIQVRAMMEALIGAGVAGEALIQAVESFVLATQKEPSAGAIRMRRLRERRAAEPSQPVTVRHEPSLGDGAKQRHTASHRVTCDAPSLSFLEELDSPERGEPERERALGKRASRVTAEWQPTESDRSYARDQGLDPEEIHRAADDFRDYWCAKPGAGGTKLDWAATWRSWVRRTGDDKRKRNEKMAPVARFPDGGRRGAGSIVDLVARRYADDAN